MVLGLLLLSACGQKGPLYLPTGAPAPTTANTTAPQQSNPVPR
jgi:predicted small lipoprotein YifL